MKTTMKTIGPYEIVGALGRGGMSRVYKVKLPRIDKIAALKVFAPSRKLVQSLGLQALREQFVFEATVIGRIRHPNVLSVWSLEETEDGPCYLMAYFCHNLGILMGETYWADTPSRILPVSRAVRYARGTLAGLARLHFDGIVHRDIKPFNLMITDDDAVTIADFGLSKRRGETLAVPHDMLLGTRGYAAPEQALDPASVDARADLYAAAVTLYRMLTGRLPQIPARPVSAMRSDLDGAWDDFFARALNADPQARFADAEKMDRALGGLYDAYVDNQTKACQPDRGAGAGPVPQPSGSGRLRSAPRTVTGQRAASVFSLDRLNRPLGHAVHRLAAAGDRTVYDESSGLLWQAGGSRYQVTLAEARAYIGQLNRDRFAQRDDWRLATVDELLSLVRAPGEAGFCLEPVFDTDQRWIWSCDRRSKRSAWYVDMELGFVAAHDDTGYFFAKAVAG